MKQQNPPNIFYAMMGVGASCTLPSGAPCSAELPSPQSGEWMKTYPKPKPNARLVCIMKSPNMTVTEYKSLGIRHPFSICCQRCYIYNRRLLPRKRNKSGASWEG